MNQCREKKKGTSQSQEEVKSQTDRVPQSCFSFSSPAMPHPRLQLSLFPNSVSAESHIECKL